MSPKTKSKKMTTRSCKKSVPKTEKNDSKKTSPIKRRSQRRTVPKTPENKKSIEPIPSTSKEVDPSCSSTVENKNSQKEDVSVTPKVMKYCLNAYKQSPDYEDLRKRRFNTSFRYESPRGAPDIQIFSTEEGTSPKSSENLPSIKNKIKREPGETYADIFLSIPGLSDSELDEIPEIVVEAKITGKKGKKRSIGYKGVPLPDECLLTDYSTLLYSSE